MDENTRFSSVPHALKNRIGGITMQLQMTTDYAMRIIGYMLTNEATDKTQLVKAKSMAETLGIDYQYSMKVINQLKKADILKSVQGCAGGYYLDECVGSLTFYDVIELMEGEVHLLKCLEEDICTRKKDVPCPVQCEFHNLEITFIDKLKEINVYEVCKGGF